MLTDATKAASRLLVLSALRISFYRLTNEITDEINQSHKSLLFSFDHSRLGVDNKSFQIKIAQFPEM